MKKIIFSILTLGTLAIFSGKLMAQTSATVSATPAGAVLVIPMTLTQTAPLHFGTSVLLNAVGGTIQLPSNSTTRVYGTPTAVAASAVNPAPTNAAYTVGGTRLETYSITLPGTTTVTAPSGTVKTMDITLMKAWVNSASGEATTGTLDTNGADHFTLGGTLTVKANQDGGVYSGTFAVTVDYN